MVLRRSATKSPVPIESRWAATADPVTDIPRMSKACLKAAAVNSAGSSTARLGLKACGRRGAPCTHEHTAWHALEPRPRGLARYGNGHAVFEGVVLDAGVPVGRNAGGGGRVGCHVQVGHVLVEAKRRNRCAVGPLQVVPTPRGGVGLVEKEAVVADHIAFDRAHTGLLDLLGQQFENCQSKSALAALQARRCCGRICSRRRFDCGRGRSWRVFLRGIRRRQGRLIRIMPRAQRWIANAQEHQIAMQNACCVDVAGGDYVGGPRKCFDRQEGECGSGGGELRVGGGGKQPSFIQAIERLAIERGDADAELRMAQCGFGKDRLNAFGDLPPCGGRMRWLCRAGLAG